jgi:hypothetical protein
MKAHFRKHFFDSRFKADRSTTANRLGAALDLSMKMTDGTQPAKREKARKGTQLPVKHYGIKIATQQRHVKNGDRKRGAAVICDSAASVNSLK